VKQGVASGWILFLVTISLFWFPEIQRQTREAGNEIEESDELLIGLELRLLDAEAS